MADLKSMTVTELLKLRSDVDTALADRREELHSQLREIGGGGSANGKRGSSALAGLKVAAKYRHPKTGETWSGRGGTAGWLAAEIKAGKKKEDFLISAAKSNAVKPAKTAKKAKKKS